jgi:hypothetical protein
MDLSNYLRLAVYFCLMMIIFTLAVNFVSGLGIFTSADTGVNSSGTPSDIFTEISGFTGGFQYIWVVLLTTGGFATIVIAKIVGSTNIIGVYLFSAVFWTSFSRCLTVVNIGGWVQTDFLNIFIVAIFFVWVAAIISMLTSVS